MLAALSQRTESVELGQLVTCVGYRNVGLLAKEAACIDVMSGGRLILGLGAGLVRTEYEAYGWDYAPARRPPRPAPRGARGGPPAVVARSPSSFDGEHVQLRGAFCEPQPLSLPGRTRPRILVGGGGEKVTLRIAAELADATNWQVGLEAFVHKSGCSQRHCEAIGRDPEEIMRTHGPDCLIVESDADLSGSSMPRGGQLWGRGEPEEWVRDNLVGTPEQVAEKAQGFIDAGCSEFILWFRDAPSHDSMEAWMTEVVPKLS